MSPRGGDKNGISQRNRQGCLDGSDVPGHTLGHSGRRQASRQASIQECRHRQDRFLLLRGSHRFQPRGSARGGIILQEMVCFNLVIGIFPNRVCAERQGQIVPFLKVGQNEDFFHNGCVFGRVTLSTKIGNVTFHGFSFGIG